MNEINELMKCTRNNNFCEFTRNNNFVSVHEITIM